MKVANLIILILSFGIVSAFFKSDDPSNIFSECPNFKPKEVIDKESLLNGRWYFLKYYGTRKTGATCVSINFEGELGDDSYTLSYTSEFNGFTVSSVKNWTSTSPGELVLDTMVNIPTLGGMKQSRLYYKVCC